MRAFGSFVVPLLVTLLAACITPSLDLGDGDSAAASTTDAGASADAGFVGGGCGLESTTGAELCIATTMCPTLVVDTQATPHCGFRLRNGVPDLVCACGTSICSMGVFDTCLQAASLLADQTEAAVCAQVPDGRCLEMTPPTTPIVDQQSTSSSSSTSGGGTGCDTQCVKDCGGGAACAAVCNCD